MKEKLTKYEVWSESEGTELTLTTQRGVAELKRKGILSRHAKRIHVITAATSEEAHSIYNLRMGFGPYKPMGKPKRCPNYCGSFFYPESGGECPYCGPMG